MLKHLGVPTLISPTKKLSKSNKPPRGLSRAFTVIQGRDSPQQTNQEPKINQFKPVLGCFWNFLKITNGRALSTDF